MTPRGPDGPFPVASIGLFGNADKPELPAAFSTILDRTRPAGVKVKASADLAAVVPDDVETLNSEDLVEAVDLVIALGGDGTMLRAGRVLGLTGVPLLGVNLGSLGYLTDVPLDELGATVERLLKGDYLIETRSRVYCSIWKGEDRVARASALNDLVVNMGPLPRALDMELMMDGDSLGRFLGDGIIISTPTGSTAYNLSAGGPICQSDVPCLLVAPICPHSLGMRPLIVSQGTRIELVVHQTGDGAVLTSDGQKTHVLDDGDRVVFRQADREVNLVKFPQSSFYRVMRHKLKWGATSRRPRPKT